MKPLTALLVATMSGLPVAAASAQTVQSMQVYYEQNRPYVRLEGISPVYWAPTATAATVSVQGRSISISFCIDIGFSVMSPWQVSVPLNLPETNVYGIGVYLQCGGSEQEQIGFLSAWVDGGFDPLFSAGFE